MKKVSLKKSVQFPVSLEIAPYKRQMFYPGNIYDVSDGVYMANSTSFFDIAVMANEVIMPPVKDELLSDPIEVTVEKEEVPEEEIPAPENEVPEEDEPEDEFIFDDGEEDDDETDIGDIIFEPAFDLLEDSKTETYTGPKTDTESEE